MRSDPFNNGSVAARSPTGSRFDTANSDSFGGGMDDVAQSFAAVVAGITSAAITGKSAFTLTTGLMSEIGDISPLGGWGLDYRPRCSRS